MFRRTLRRVLYRIGRLCEFIGSYGIPMTLAFGAPAPLHAQNLPTIASSHSQASGFSNLSEDYEQGLSDGFVRCETDPFCDSFAEPFVLLPQGYIYPTYLANPHEPRAGTQWVYEEEDGWLWDSTVGGRVGLFRWGPPDYPTGAQLDILGAAKLRMDPKDEFDVRSVDFRIDVPLSWDYGPHRFKLGYSHVSSHVGDEFLLKNPGFDRLNYVRDSILFGYSYYPLPSWRLYGEASYGFYTRVAEPWGFTFGVDYAPAVPTGLRGAPFAAVNATLREEVGFGGGFAAQAGWSWRSIHNPSGLLRTGLFYYNGKSPQYSFFEEHEQQTGFGIWYDY